MIPSFENNVLAYLDVVQMLSTDDFFYLNPYTKEGWHGSHSLSLIGIPSEIESFPESFSSIFHKEDIDLIKYNLSEILNGDTVSLNLRFKKDGTSYIWATLTTMPVLNTEEDITEIVCKIEVMTEQNLKTNLDPLTQVLNENGMRDRVELILQDIQDVSHAVICINLDDFSKVNEEYNVEFGNYLLTELGHRLKESIRSDDMIGRISGDEFVLFMRNIPSFELLLRKAKELLRAISDEVAQGEMSYKINASMGIAVFPEHGLTYEELNESASAALRRSKNRGKNVATIYNGMVEERQHKVEVENVPFFSVRT